MSSACERKLKAKETSFERYLVRQNLSLSTVRLYQFTVDQFYHIYPRLNSSSLLGYKAYLMDHYKPQTVNLRLRALNSYLTYRQSALPRLSMVKIQQKTYLDRIISQTDYEYLKRRLKEDDEYTYYYLIWLMTATGVRVSEAVSFRIEDIASGHKDIYSKGNKMRRIYIPTALKSEILQWTSLEKRVSGPLFLNRYGAPLGITGIRARLKSFAGRYQLDPQVMYPHSFRHRFAKNFIEAYGDVAILSDLLGHESIETTRIYLRRSAAEQRRIVNQVIDW